MEIQFIREDIVKIVAGGHDEARLIKGETGIYRLTRDPHMVVFSSRRETGCQGTRFVHPILVRSLQAALAAQPPLPMMEIIVTLNRIKTQAIVKGANVT